MQQLHIECPFEFRGQIEKEGSWFRSWKRRAILFRHGVLHYAEPQSSGTDLLGSIKGYVNVCGGIVDSVSKAVHNRKYMIACADTFGRRVAFQAPGDEELEQWLPILRNASNAGVCGDGWLDKRASIGSGAWKRRYCMLRGCRLYWSKSASDPPLGEVDLIGCEVTVADIAAAASGADSGPGSKESPSSDTYEVTFTVVCKSRADGELSSDPILSKPRSLEFRAPNKQVMLAWTAWFTRAATEPLVAVHSSDEVDGAAKSEAQTRIPHLLKPVDTDAANGQFGSRPPSDSPVAMPEAQGPHQPSSLYGSPRSGEVSFDTEKPKSADQELALNTTHPGAGSSVRGLDPRITADSGLGSGVRQSLRTMSQLDSHVTQPVDAVQAAEMLRSDWPHAAVGTPSEPKSPHLAHSPPEHGIGEAASAKTQSHTPKTSIPVDSIRSSQEVAALTRVSVLGDQEPLAFDGISNKAKVSAIGKQRISSQEATTRKLKAANDHDEASKSGTISVSSVDLEKAAASRIGSRLQRQIASTKANDLRIKELTAQSIDQKRKDSERQSRLANADARIESLKQKLSSTEEEARSSQETSGRYKAQADEAKGELERVRAENEAMRLRLEQLEFAARAADTARADAVAAAEAKAEADATARFQKQALSRNKGKPSAARTRKGAKMKPRSQQSSQSTPAADADADAVTEMPAATALPTPASASCESLEGSNTVGPGTARSLSHHSHQSQKQPVDGADRKNASDMIEAQSRIVNSLDLEKHLGETMHDQSASSMISEASDVAIANRSSKPSRKNHKIGSARPEVAALEAIDAIVVADRAPSKVDGPPSPPPPPRIVAVEDWVQEEEGPMRTRMREKLATFVLERVPPPAPGRGGQEITERLAVAVPSFARRAERLCYAAVRSYADARARFILAHHHDGQPNEIPPASHLVSAAWQEQQYTSHGTLEVRIQTILHMEISPAASQLGGDLGDGHGAELVARAAHALSRAGEAASSGAGASVDEGSGVRPDRTKTLLLQLLGIALPDERKGPLAAGPMDASASRNALALAIDSAPDIESVTNSDGRFGHWGGADAPHPRDMLSLVVQPVRHFPRRLNDEETAGDLQGQVKLATLSLKLVLERRPCQAPNLPALNRWQGRRCAACGCGITTGMFGTSSSAACYCWYSELLLCPPCFRGGAAGSSLDPDSGAKLRWRTLPWRMMHRLEPSSSNPGGTKVSRSSGDASAVSWAFPVCAQAAKFIDKITTLPVVEMSLWAPHLFFGPGGPPPGCIVRIAAGGRAGHLVWKIDPQFGSCMDAESGRIDPVDARGVTEEVLAGLRRICVSRLSSGEETADEPCDDYLTCIATGAPLDPPVKPRQPLGDVALARERRRRRLATAPRHLQTMRRLRRQMLRAAIALALASDVSEEALLGVAMQFARDALAVALVVAFARGSRISLPKRVVMQARAGATESIADNVIQDDGSSNVSEATDLDMAVGRSAASVLAHFPKDKVAKAVSQVQDLVGTLCSHEERLSLVHVVRASTGVLNPPLGDAAAALADRLPSQCVLPTLPLSMQATVQLPSDVDEDRAAGNVESMRRARALHIEVAGPSVGTADDTVIWSTDRSIAPSNTESPESV